MLPTRTVFGLLAFGAPFGLYLATASGSSYFLDAGEIVAASVALDVAHPPGQPLSVLYGKAFSLLPLGSIAFRIALGQALAAALACALLFVATSRVLAVVAPGAAKLAHPLALLAGVLFGGSYALWIQAVRPEVYALQGALLALALERMVAAHTEVEGAPRRRALYAAAFAVGLGLANHHVMSALAIPALALIAARTGRLRPWWVCAGLGALACGTYAYLPLRAATDPPFNSGDPSTLGRFVWVVSARMYAGRVGDPEVAPLAERFGSALLAVLDVTHAVGLGLALVGLYALLRARAQRPIAATLSSCAVLPLAVSPLLNVPTGNPDAVGYMLLGLAVLALLASVGLAAVASALSGIGPRAGRGVAAAVVVLVVLAAAEHVARNHAAADLSAFAGTDAVDASRLEGLPPRALLVVAMPQTVFRAQELWVVDGARPDVTLLPLSLLTYPGGPEVVARRRPELRSLAVGFAATQKLSLPRVLEVAAERPVVIELDAHTPLALYPSLVPLGGLHALVGLHAPRMWPRAQVARDRANARVDAVLRGTRERETVNQLLFVRYMDALHAAAVGQHEAALRWIAAAQELAPHDLKARAFEDALRARASAAPFDVSPFLGASR